MTRRLTCARGSGDGRVAKGPLYFLTSDLARGIFDDGALMADGDAAVAAVAARASAGVVAKLIPYEDIWTGYAVSRLDVGRRRVAFRMRPGTLSAARASLGVVHLPWSLFAERWGFFLARSTIVWHMKLKDPERLRLAHLWVQRHHCAVPPQTPLRCRGVKRMACGAAHEHWPMCTAAFSAAHCSDELIDLKNRSVKRRSRRRAALAVVRFPISGRTKF